MLVGQHSAGDRPHAQSNRIFFASLSVKCASMCVSFALNATTYMYLRTTAASKLEFLTTWLLH